MNVSTKTLQLVCMIAWLCAIILECGTLFAHWHSSVPSDRKFYDWLSLVIWVIFMVLSLLLTKITKRREMERK